MKNCFLILLLTTTFSVFAQKSKRLILRGDVGNANEWVEDVVLFYSNNNHSKDSCIVKNGKYMFDIEIDKPGGAVLQFRFRKDDVAQKEIENYHLYLAPGNMTVTCKGSVANCIVTGSRWNEDYQIYIQKQKELLVEYTARNAEAIKRESTGDTTNARKHQKDAQKFLDSASLKMTIDYASAHPNSPVTLTALFRAAGYPFKGERIQPIYEKLPASLRNSEEGKLLKESIDNSLKVGMGKMAPDFTQPDTAGVNVTLSSFRGKYVLLDFWANWCVFCRMESPYMIEAFEKYKNKGFTIVSVSVDKKEDKDKWLKAIHDDGVYRWTQVADLKGTEENAARKVYSVTGYPTNFLIDPQGKIIAMNLRGADLEKKLAEVIHN